MNYYERHLGDYARDTAHLSMLEHGAYSLLLDRYYATEAGIPADQAHRLARARTKEEKQAVDAVLSEFFELVDGIWINKRAEEEIAKAQTRINAAKENGKRGGRPKKNQTETQGKPGGFSVGSVSETQEKAHQAPSTIHQTPDINPVTPPGDLTNAGAGGVSPGDLTKPMVQAGIRCNPGHPDIIALAAAGCTPDTVGAAIAEAKLTKQNPPQGYVVAILKRWQAEQNNPGGAPRPPPSKQDERAEWARQACPGIADKNHGGRNEPITGNTIESTAKRVD